MTELIVARALHVLGVIVWIGGVSMVSVVMLPAAIKNQLGADPSQTLRAVERRFKWIARVAVLVVGLTGIYMVEHSDLWSRFCDFKTFWWMHAMVMVWLIFSFILFIASPLNVFSRLGLNHKSDPKRTLARAQKIHLALLLISTITVLGAVAGSHGWDPFG